VALSIVQDQMSHTSAAITDAVMLWERIAGATPPDHDRHIERINVLASLLQLRSRSADTGADLDRSIELWRHAIATATGTDGATAMVLNTRGASLLTRFELRGQPDDPSASLGALVEAAALARSADRAMTAMITTNLADAWRLSYEHTANTADLT